MTQLDLLLLAIHLEPQNSLYYYNLGIALPVGATVQLPDCQMNKQDLFKKSIELNPNFARAYLCLGKTLPAGGSILLLDGTSRTKQQLFNKALSLDFDLLSRIPSS